MSDSPDLEDPRPVDDARPIDGGPGDGRALSREPRPIIERLGLAAIALVIAALFGGVAAASWIGGEPFLAIMGGIGCLMTIWVGVMTLLRG